MERDVMTSGIPNIGAERSLSRYLREIRTQPVLSLNEEMALARRWRECQDVEAAHRLVTSHMRLTAKIAMGYRGYGLPLGDLINEGNVGLIQAVKRFDPDRGWGDLRPEQVTKIAETLKVLEPEVISMSYRLSAPDQSLSAPVHTDGNDEWLDLLADQCDSQETILLRGEELDGRHVLLHDALKSLNSRERQILTARRLSDTPATLRELAHQYGISSERVRRIEGRAIQKLQHAMNVPGAD